MTTTEIPDLVARALALGWSVIPCRSDKRPCLPWKEFQSRSPTLDEVQSWQSEYNPSAWAVITGTVSGVVVLDFDGETGERSRTRLGLSPHVKTGSGGSHVYIDHPGWDTPTVNGQSRLTLGEQFPGLDVRGDGGYAIFCGRNESGSYQWVREMHPDPLDAIPSNLRSLLGLLQPPGGGGHRSQNSTNNQPNISDRVAADVLIRCALEKARTGRNDAGFWLAVQLRDNGYSRAEAEEVLLEFASRVSPLNSKGHDEPYTRRESMASVEQAYQHSPREPWTKSRPRVAVKSPIATVQSQHTEQPSEGLLSHNSLFSHPRDWPTPLAEQAYHGLAGEFVRMVEPHSESDPAALLTQFLAAVGNVIGRGPHFVAEADEHHLSLYVTLVGRTAKGRKGSSLSHVRRVLKGVGANWEHERVMSGLASGEGLIWSVRDPVYGLVRDKKTGEFTEQITDVGVDDKRLLVVESEFARTLQVCSREGNTLSAVMREAFDGRSLRILTKNNPATASDAHVSIIAHITQDELLRTLNQTEMANGFCNRFLWVCTERSKLLPDGGLIESVDFGPFTVQLNQAILFAKSVGEIRRDEQARTIWHKEYARLSDGLPGLLGAITSRAEALVMRLACLYAVLDQSAVIHPDHLSAALAVWQYCESSARFIFGDSLGDLTADTILQALRTKADGMPRTEISGLFSRHKKRADIDRALAVLAEHGLVVSQSVKTDGAPATVWSAL